MKNNVVNNEGIGERKSGANPKRIPYGMQNFEDLRLKDCYYVDKTRFIPKIEEANPYFFFIRPRRFGKSLMMNMLRQYYNIQKRDLFEQLFGDLWIGRHPTKERNSYLVLYLNFGMASSNIENYEKRFNGYCRIQFEGFVEDYAEYFPDNALDQLRVQENAASQLAYIIDRCNKAGKSVYMFIDEYDHFTNSILSTPDVEVQYKAITHGNGLLRTFFDTIKGGTDGCIKRLFVTGVSPVTMDDLTSGFNIGTNYTAEAKFNDMVGFTEEEVWQMLDYYRQFGWFKHTTDELLDIMRPWYDNYCFSEDSIGAPTLFNSDMTLFFMYKYRDRNGKLPSPMIDANIRTDYSKLRMLIRKDREFAHDASIIQHIVEAGGIAATIKEAFPSEAITQPDNFISLLFYFGMLTIAGSKRGKTWLSIPNQTVREQIYDYLLETYGDNHLRVDDYYFNDIETAMAYDGDWKNFFEYIALTLKRFAAQRDKQKGEAFVHGFTPATTCRSHLYMPHSELDTGIGRGYADIYLEPLIGLFPDIEHSFIIELKWCRSDASDAEVQAVRRDGVEQALRYSESEVVTRTKGNTRLHCLVIVWRGMELVVAEEV